MPVDVTASGLLGPGQTVGANQVTTTNDQSREGYELLEQLFDLAAAKSLAVINQAYAEPEMSRFLHAVKQHPDQRPNVVRLFMHSFSTDYYMSTPWQFFAFCMHSLSWPELRDFIVAKRNEDVQRRGAASSTVWNDILAAFEDDWRYAPLFREFRKGEK
jgi:hypothetical protein